MFVVVIQIQSKGLTPHRMGCMDEFSIFIDSDGFNNQNPAAFQLFASSEDKPVFDVVLSALSNGTFLPPLLFFRGGLSRVPDGFPKNVLLEARQEGFTDQERLQIWINKVCTKISFSLVRTDVQFLSTTVETGLDCLDFNVGFQKISLSLFLGV